MEGLTSPVPGSAPSAEIIRLDAAGMEARLNEFVELLRDSVADGASVGYIAVPGLVEATDFWRGAISAVATGAAELFVALHDGRAVGTVQLHPSGKPNQLHRADVAKLLVHSSARRLGIGNALMHAAEARAVERGLALLTLDTCEGGVAERLYARRGWMRVGVIPGFAIHTDGLPGGTAIYYKSLGTPA